MPSLNLSAITEVATVVGALAQPRLLGAGRGISVCGGVGGCEVEGSAYDHRRRKLLFMTENLSERDIMLFLKDKHFKSFTSTRDFSFVHIHDPTRAKTLLLGAPGGPVAGSPRARGAREGGRRYATDPEGTRASGGTPPDCHRPRGATI